MGVGGGEVEQGGRRRAEAAAIGSSIDAAGGSAAVSTPFTEFFPACCKDKGSPSTPPEDISSIMRQRAAACVNVKEEGLNQSPFAGSNSTTPSTQMGPCLLLSQDGEVTGERDKHGETVQGQSSTGRQLKALLADAFEEREREIGTWGRKKAEEEGNELTEGELRGGTDVEEDGDSQ
ncbi:unnamed protein product [Discosporangium mesarthrocarpum]